MYSREKCIDLQVMVIYEQCIVVANKSKVLHGLLKEPELNIALDDEEDAQEPDDKPKVCRETCIFIN